MAEIDGTNSLFRERGRSNGDVYNVDDGSNDVFAKRQALKGVFAKVAQKVDGVIDADGLARACDFGNARHIG